MRRPVASPALDLGGDSLGHGPRSARAKGTKRRLRAFLGYALGGALAVHLLRVAVVRLLQWDGLAACARDEAFRTAVAALPAVESRPSGAGPLSSTFTVLVNTYARPAMLLETVSHYRECLGVDAVRIVWCNEAGDPPEIPPGSPAAAPVSFELIPRGDDCSLNARFRPLAGLRTSAVFSADDDVAVACSSLSTGFAAWRHRPRSLAGYHARLHEAAAAPAGGLVSLALSPLVPRPRGGCRWRYVWESPALRSRGVYSMVLTKAAFLHADYLGVYSRSAPDAMRRFVRDRRNCEDIAMAFVVANATGEPPTHVPGASIRDSGRGGGLSGAGSHQTTRDDCLNAFAGFFGGMPLVAAPLTAVEEGLNPARRRDPYAAFAGAMARR